MTNDSSSVTISDEEEVAWTAQFRLWSRRNTTQRPKYSTVPAELEIQDSDNTSMTAQMIILILGYILMLVTLLLFIFMARLFRQLSMDIRAQLSDNHVVNQGILIISYFP